MYSVHTQQTALGRMKAGDVQLVTELTDLQGYTERADIEPPCTRRLTDAELRMHLDQPYRGRTCHAITP